MVVAHGTRPRGEPKASVKAVLAAADAAKPPLCLFLGPAGLPLAKEAYASRIATWEEWREFSDAATG